MKGAPLHGPHGEREQYPGEWKGLLRRIDDHPRRLEAGRKRGYFIGLGIHLHSLIQYGETNRGEPA